MASYGTPVAPTALLGYLLEAQTRVLLGIGGASDLETTSWPARNYNAPIGLAAGCGLDLGSLVNLSFSHTPTVNPIEAANFENPLAFEISGEECEVTVEIQEIKPQVLLEAFATGALYILGSEALVTFGGGCNLKEMPLVLEFTNLSCNTPSSPNIGSGINGGILTLYKTHCTSGVSLSALNAREKTTLPLTFRVVHDTSRSKRNQLGSLYLY